MTKGKLHPEVLRRQKELTRKYGITTFDMYGNINFDEMTLDQFDKRYDDKLGYNKPDKKTETSYKTHFFQYF